MFVPSVLCLERSATPDAASWQHVGQDAAVPVEIEFIERIDPAGQRDLPRSTIHHDDVDGDALALHQGTLSAATNINPVLLKAG
jgi:hypothetical protein